MPLKHAASGHWVNSDWSAGAPGAFALIVGVSRYPFLQGQDTFGLDQLCVSALTAWRVFEWLRDDYLHRDCPVAQCWLLLSPTEEELEIAPAMRVAAGPAGFNDVKSAIKQWAQAMKDQGDGASNSRGFFFFSGHGIEITNDEQVLLPADYLEPPNPSLNDAISARNLANGLIRNPVPLHLMFIDACRNDHEALLAEELEGAKILNVGGKRNTGAIVDIMRATASGSKAWQPDDAEAGESIFGQALLEGLRNRRLRTCTGDACWIPLFPLAKFMKARVMEILRSYDALVESPVRLGGEVDDAVVTELPPDAGDRPPSTAPPATDTVDQALMVRADFSAWSPRREHFSQTMVEATHSPRSDHDIFGSERMEAVWRSARVFDTARGAWLPEADDFVLHRFARDERAGLFRAEVSVPSQTGPVLLEMRQPWLVESWGAPLDIRIPRTFGCLLPADAGKPVRYQVTMNLERSAEEVFRQAAELGVAIDGPTAPFRWLSRVEVDLALDNAGSLGVAASLWRTLRRDGIAYALGTSAMAELSRRKAIAESPLSALVWVIAVLRGRQFYLLRREDVFVLRNLAIGYPTVPDLAVLWAEQLIRDEIAREATADDPLQWLNEAKSRGVPWTITGLSSAMAIAADLAAEGGATRTSADELRAHFRALARITKSAGFCAVFRDVESLGESEPARADHSAASPEEVAEPARAR